MDSKPKVLAVAGALSLIIDVAVDNDELVGKKKSLVELED